MEALGVIGLQAAEKGIQSVATIQERLQQWISVAK